MQTNDFDILSALQRGLPLTPAPFEQLAQDCGCSEAEVLILLRKHHESGLIRRFGAIFDSTSLGYRSTLCAAALSEDQIQRCEEQFAHDNEVTHAYTRAAELNLWFTLTAPANQLDQHIERYAKLISPSPLRSFHATRRFKISTAFGKNNEVIAPAGLPGPAKKKVVQLSEQEQQIVRWFQGDIPMVAELYELAATELKMPLTELLKKLNTWQETGLIRRIAAITRHHRLGIKGNAMCAWQLSLKHMASCGVMLAKRPEVSHCYERNTAPEFPYNLFAMVHAESPAAVGAVFAELTEKLPCNRAGMLQTIRELKKTSPIYFMEPHKCSSL